MRRGVRSTFVTPFVALLGPLRHAHAFALAGLEAADRTAVEQLFAEGALAVLCSTGGLVIFGSLTGALNRWSDVTRIGIFVALALSGFFALLHAVVVHEFSERTTALLRGVILMGGIYFAGIGFYVTSFPESVAPRSLFDRFGASHQYWHACVLLAAYVHFRTVFSLYCETALFEAAQGLVNPSIAAAVEL